MSDITGTFALDPTLLAIVGATSTRLVGTYGFTSADRDDIRQELLLDCIVRFRKFNPAKSSRRTFLHRVVRHRVATLVDAHQAACRDYRLCRDSLDCPAEFGASESIPLGETVSADDYEDGIGQNALSSHERMELQIDIRNISSLLPPHLAVIADLLKCSSASEVGRRLALSRATVYRRIADIRLIFATAGLDNYLRSSKISQSLPTLGALACASPAKHESHDRPQHRAESHSGVKRKYPANGNEDTK